MLAALLPRLVSTVAVGLAAATVGSGVAGSGGSGGGGLGGSAAPVSPAPQPKPVAVDRLLGQRLMVGFPGTSASASLLRTVRAGHIGAVLLFAQNVSSAGQLRALTSSLQRAARQGHNPPLLIAVDQEGGEVKRLSGPPDLSPPQITARASTKLAGQEGSATGRYLRGLGINMDLAPVLDVPTFSGAFIWQQGRAFSFDPNTVARYATPFALGLQSTGVAATGKHFPGLGSAAVSTDNQLDELHPTRAQRQGALVPYKALIPRGLDAVMVSVAGFPAYDPSGAPAALSSRIIGGILRHQLHFGGVAITDSLGAPTGHSEVSAGVLAARAGADMLLFTDSAPGVLSALERAYDRHQIGRSAAATSYQRILALKARLAGSGPAR